MNPGRGLCVLICALPHLQTCEGMTEDKVDLERGGRTLKALLCGWSFTVKEESWGQPLRRLVTRTTSQQGFQLVGGSLEPDLACRTVRLKTRTGGEIKTSLSALDLSEVSESKKYRCGVTSYRPLPPTRCFWSGCGRRVWSRSLAGL